MQAKSKLKQRSIVAKKKKKAAPVRATVKRSRATSPRVAPGAVASKYIGETEKDLRRTLSTAPRTGSVLFLDEADALMGKRTEVKDSHDRYANVEMALARRTIARKKAD